MTIDESSRAAQSNRKKYPELADAIDFFGVVEGPANVIMQLAWPEVGWGVKESPVDSGNVYRRPFKRARTTFTYLAVSVLGTDADKREYRRQVTRIHARIRSAENSPVKYSALDPKLQMWVAACLYMGFEDVFEWLHGPMTDPERESFYGSAQTLGTTLQVSADQWPPSRAAFEDYWTEGLTRLRIDEPVREHLLGIAELKMLPKPLGAPFSRIFRWITIGFLHQPFREALRVDWTSKDQRRFNAFLRFTAGVNRLLPRVIRQGGYRLLLLDLRWRMRTGRPLA